MQSLWEMYQKEKYNREVISNANGFIAYNKYADSSVYISDFFVKPDARNNGEGSRLEEALIEKENPTEIWCDVETKLPMGGQVLSMFVNKGKYVVQEIAENDRYILRKVLR